MGIKVDLAIHDLEEAHFLDATLLNAASHHKAVSKLKMATAEEKAQAEHNYELALRLRERMNGR